MNIPQTKIRSIETDTHHKDTGNMIICFCRECGSQYPHDNRFHAINLCYKCKTSLKIPVKTTKTVIKADLTIVKNDDSEITKEQQFDYIEKMTAYSDKIGFQFGGFWGLCSEKDLGVEGS